MPLEAGTLGEAVLEEPRHERFGFGQRSNALAKVARRDHPKLLAQAPGAMAMHDPHLPPRGQERPVDVGVQLLQRRLDAHPDQEGQPASARIGANDPELDSLNERFAVQQMLQSLPDREQHIVYLRFYEGLTQSEIAERVGISQMHVSRLLMKSLELMASQAAADGLDVDHAP